MDKDTQKRRLLDRGLTEEQIETRMACQYTYKRKKYQIEEEIRNSNHGNLWTVDNSNDIDIESNPIIKEILHRGLDV